MSKLYTILLFIFIFLSLFTFSKTSYKNSNLLLPSLSTLLNQIQILITQNGIHFYDSNQRTESSNKFIPLNISSISRPVIEQFPIEFGGYILILLKNIIYIFSKDEIFINSIDISNYIKDNYDYSITPYKKEDNNLHYIISYVDLFSKKIKLLHFKFNLKTLINEKINSKSYDITIEQISNYQKNIIGTSCTFLLSEKNNNIDSNTLLTCVYGVELPYEIHVRTFDPKNNFNELNDYTYLINNSTIYFNHFDYISGITNLDKNKLFIFYVYKSSPFTISFDFKNNFTSFKEYKSVKLDGNYTYNKIIFFEQTQEIVVLSQINSNQLYIFIFDNKYELKYRSYLNKKDCSKNNIYNIYYNGNNYVILYDNNKKIEINKKRRLEASENYSNNEKCLTSTYNSSLYDLCTSCNEDNGYHEAEIEDTSLFHDFVECFNSETKPNNFYLDSSENKYKLCYETCLTCDGEGDEINNNCLECDNNHIKKPDYPDTKNCVAKCVYSYYYTPYGYYKCNNSSNCPKESSLYVKELNKCTDDCKKENKKQYSGMCLDECPEDTQADDNSICIEQNKESCSKSESEIDLQEFLTSGEIEVNAKNFAHEFSYTEKHVSYFYNNIYSILYYQDSNCITELSIDMPKVDFASCYTKVQESLTDTNEKLIIGLVERLNGNQKPTISYYFYHPTSGEKLDADTICKDEEIVIKENVMNQLNSTHVDVGDVKFLTDQKINVFDELDSFYTDICYHYESPNGKDIPLKERIRIYYPNITICDVGCTNKGVDLTTMESICECKFNNILNNDMLEENALIKGTLGEIKDIISNSNLDVLKCYQDVFKKKYIVKNAGGFIILILFFFEIITAIIFLVMDMSKIRKYIYGISENYINLLDKNNKKQNMDIVKNKISIKEPPRKLKKNINKEEKQKFSFSQKNEKSTNSRRKYTHISTKSLTNKNQFSNTLNNIRNENLSTENSNKPLNMEEYLKTDYDDMDYDDATKFDKRSFCEFFIDRLKTKQMIADTFYNKDNIRPFSIKLLLLLMNITLYFAINGLFFSEEYIIELYHLEKEDSFFSYIPRSMNRFFYTTMVSVIVGIIIDCIFIEEKKIKRILIREKDDLLQLRYEISVVIKSIKTRYSIFIILCFFISLISWYYVSCFNNVYKGEKIEWIKSSITIIIIMQLLSIIRCLLEAILREISFQCKSEKIYKFRQILS